MQTELTQVKHPNMAGLGITHIVSVVGDNGALYQFYYFAAEDRISQSMGLKSQKVLNAVKDIISKSVA